MKLLIKIILLLLFNLLISAEDISIDNVITLDENDIPELKYLDENVDPCENFYEFSCGNFAKYNPLPEKEKTWDNYYILQKEIDDNLTILMDNPKQPTDLKAVKKLKDMYQACMGYEKYDEYYKVQQMASAVKKIGGWPLLHKDDSFKNKDFKWTSVADIVAKYGLQLFFSYTINPLPLDPNQFWIQMNKDSLVLPQTIIAPMDHHPEELFEDTLKHARSNGQENNPYVKYVYKIATAMCESIDCREHPSKILHDIVDVLNIMIAISKSPNYPKIHDDLPPYLMANISDLQKWTDGIQQNYTTKINWLKFFTHSFQNSDAIVTDSTIVYVANTSAIVNILDLVENTNKDIINNFIVSRLTTYMAPDSDRNMWSAYNDLYRETYGNKYPIYDRPDYCKRKIMNSQMMYVLSQQYYTYLFDNRKLKNAKKLIKDLEDSFQDILNEKDWLDKQGLKNAKKKLKKMVEFIGFPQFIFHDSKLEKFYKNMKVCMHDHFENMQNLRAFNFAKSVEVLGHKRDVKRWSNTPLQVNAFYNPSTNRIVFPAAIMNLPFYTGKFSVVDYGRIGSIIGHELTHGFDPQGAKFDQNGRPSDIFSPEITAIFKNKSSCFVEQYSKYWIDEIESYVDGSVTLRENMADNGGLRESYKAYLETIGGERTAMQTTKYDSKQLFFIAYGTNYCKIDTKESLEIMKKDSHAPNRFRVIGVVSNMEEFAEAFHCPLGSPMNPPNKCILW